MRQRQFNGLFDLLNLLIQTADVCIGLLRRFLQLHHIYNRIRVVAQHADHGMHFVVHQNRTVRLQLLFIYKRENRHVVLAADRGGHDRMIVVDDLLQIAHAHRIASQLVHPGSFVVLVLVVELCYVRLAVGEKLFFHDQPVEDALQFDQLQSASGVWCDDRQLGRRVRSFLLAMSLAPLDWHRRWLAFAFLFIIFILVFIIISWETERLCLTLVSAAMTERKIRSQISWCSLLASHFEDVRQTVQRVHRD